MAGDRARLQQLQVTLAKLSGMDDPLVAATRAKLALELDQVQHRLKGLQPLHAQLKAANAQMQRDLATTTALHNEVQELDLVLEARRRALEDSRLATLSSQATVKKLTAAVRAEEAVRLEACTTSALLQAPPMAAPTPSGSHEVLVGPLEWARRFCLSAPPEVARAFEHLMDVHQAAFAPAPPPVQPTVVVPVPIPTAATSLAAPVVDVEDEDLDFDAATADAAAPAAYGKVHGRRSASANSRGPYGGLETCQDTAADAEAVLASLEGAQAPGGVAPGAPATA